MTCPCPLQLARAAVFVICLTSAVAIQRDSFKGAADNLQLSPAEGTCGQLGASLKEHGVRLAAPLQAEQDGEYCYGVLTGNGAGANQGKC